MFSPKRYSTWVLMTYRSLLGVVSWLSACKISCMKIRSSHLLNLYPISLKEISITPKKYSVSSLTRYCSIHFGHNYWHHFIFILLYHYFLNFHFVININGLNIIEPKIDCIKPLLLWGHRLRFSNIILLFPIFWSSGGIVWGLSEIKL